MEDGHPFVDYYAILDVDPESSQRTLDIAYRQLAKMYHPDHPITANLDRFNDITEAYSMLRKPEKRSSYDLLYASKTGFTFTPKEARRSESMAAVSDANMHADILMFLYRKRRKSSYSPGAGTYDILRSLDCSEENFEFHAWYLRKKGYIEHTEDGQYAITVEGVDYVITMSQLAEKTLRITRSDDADPVRWAEREVVTETVQ